MKQPVAIVCTLFFLAGLAIVTWGSINHRLRIEAEMKPDEDAYADVSETEFLIEAAKGPWSRARDVGVLLHDMFDHQANEGRSRDLPRRLRLAEGLGGEPCLFGVSTVGPIHVSRDFSQWQSMCGPHSRSAVAAYARFVRNSGGNRIMAICFDGSHLDLSIAEFKNLASTMKSSEFYPAVGNDGT